MDQLKRADLLSSVGAGFLGGGIAILFQDALKTHAVTIFVI